MAALARVLLVDDDVNLLSACKRALRGRIELTVAASAEDALNTIRQFESFSVIVSDYNMPGMSGAAFLGRVAEHDPLASRIMLTGATDNRAAVDAVNTGKIFRFLQKPCSGEDLLGAIMDGVRQNQLLNAERELLEKTLNGSVKVLTDILSLVNPDAFKIAHIVRRYSARLAGAMQLSNKWEVELAAMMWPLGDITLPAEVLAKRNASAPLSKDEEALLAQSPLHAHALITNIPRLRGVAEGVHYSRKNYDGAGFPSDALSGEAIPITGRILRVALDAAEITRRDGAFSARACEEMRSKTGLYDPKIVAHVSELIEDPRAGARAQFETLSLCVAQLNDGDTTMRDVCGEDGRFLLAAGEELSAPMIVKLRQIHQLRRIAEPIMVTRQRERCAQTRTALAS